MTALDINIDFYFYDFEAPTYDERAMSIGLIPVLEDLYGTKNKMKI